MIARAGGTLRHESSSTYECAAAQAGFVLVPPELRGECVAEGAACRVAGPAFSELGVEGVEFAHDAGRAGVAGDAEGLQAETGCPCRVGLGGAGDGDGELGREVAAVAGKGAAGGGDRVFQDGDGDIGMPGGQVAGRGLLGERSQVVVVQVDRCVLVGDVGVLAESVGGLVQEGEAVAVLAEPDVAACLLLEREGV